jgi:cytochrome c553
VVTRTPRHAATALLLAWVGISAALAQPVAPPDTPWRDRLAACAGCHGANGQSTLAGVPSLAGHPRLYLENRLVMIREALSPVPAMGAILDGLTDGDLIALSRHYADLPPPRAAASRDAARAERGAAVAQRALCGSCHLPGYPGREQIPRLAGQREDYLLATMRRFLAGQAPGRDTAMTNALLGMTDADLADMAHHFATLPSPRAP